MVAFPIYQNHEVAKRNGCFNCHTDLTGEPHREEKYPIGRGHWAVKCLKCGFTKWYDLEESVTNSATNRGV